MPDIYLDIVAYGGLILLLNLLYFTFMRRVQIEKAARDISGTVSKVFGGEHIYRQVDAKDFSWLNLKFYQEITEKLTSLGFSFITDIEDLTLSELTPKLRTFTRVMAGDNGGIRAEFFNVRPWGAENWLLQFLKAAPKEFRTYAAWTEFSNGCYMNTSNSPKQYSLSPPKEIDRLLVPVDTPVEQLLQTHRERVKSYLSLNTDSSVLPVGSYDDVIATMNRILTLAAKQRRMIRGITKEEMDNISQGFQKNIVRQIEDEMERHKFDSNP